MHDFSPIAAECATYSLKVLAYGALVLLTSFIPLSCKQKSKSAAPSASASANAHSSVSLKIPGAPECIEYATRLCQIAGLESPSCLVMKGAAEIMPPKACSAGLKDISYTEKRIVKGQNTCDHLVEKVCEAVGRTTQACQKVTADTKNFTFKRCAAMVEHLPEVIAEVQELKFSAREPMSPEMQKAVLDNPVIAFGPADARVQIVEFTDFECTACSRMARLIHKVHKDYGDRVRIIVRHFPLKKHENARLAAEAAIFAHTQGKFWDFHDRLFSAKLDRATLEEHAKAAGLDLLAFKASLDNHKFAATVDSDVQMGERIPVQRTPSVFINGVRIDYASDFEAVVQQIEMALKG